MRTIRKSGNSHEFRSGMIAEARPQLIEVKSGISGTICHLRVRVIRRIKWEVIVNMAIGSSWYSNLNCFTPCAPAATKPPDDMVGCLVRCREVDHYCLLRAVNITVGRCL